jgi:hypothetical protein
MTHSRRIAVICATAIEMYEVLEADGAGYTIRLPANNVLQHRIGYLLKRPVGRPPHRCAATTPASHYQAQNWNESRRFATGNVTETGSSGWPAG